MVNMRFEIILSIFFIYGIGDWISCEDTSWDFFVFTQQWTPSLCESEGKEHKCVIPKNVSGWTVHGLWPNKDGEEKPNYCNESLKFDWKKIESLQANLTAQWPNVFADTSATDFWKHEWEKHGTCAVTLDTTGDELKYFSKALDLNRKINLTQILEKHNVVPSSSLGYKPKKLLDVLTSEFRDSSPKLQCVNDKKLKQQLLLQIEICLDKMFRFVKCDNPGPSEGDCDFEKPVYFHPLHNKTKQATASKLSEYFEMSYVEYSVIKN